MSDRHWAETARPTGLEDIRCSQPMFGRDSLCSMNEGLHPRRASYLVLLTTLWITLLMLAIKAWAGWATHSLCLLAEALHTVVDGFSTVLGLAAVSSPHRMTGREVWGYGRREVVGILVLIAVLGYTGCSLILLSLRQLEAIAREALSFSQTPFPVQIGLPLVQLMSVMLIVTLGLALFQRHEARVLDSAALRLTAHHILVDLWLSFGVLAGLMGIWRGYVWLDPVLSIALLGMLVRSLWRVLYRQIPLWVRQTAIAPEVLSQLACQVEGVTRCRCLRSQGVVGRSVYVELHLEVHPDFMPLVRMIAERVEGVIRDRYGPVHVRIGIDRDRSFLRPPVGFASEDLRDFEGDDPYPFDADWN